MCMGIEALGGKDCDRMVARLGIADDTYLVCSVENIVRTWPVTEVVSSEHSHNLQRDKSGVYIPRWDWDEKSACEEIIPEHTQH